MHGPAGFASSNVTKGLLFVTFIWSLVAQWTRKSHLFTLDLSAVASGEVWRLLTHSFVWTTSSELVLGSILLYTWRMFERMFGSRKFGACAAFLLLGSTILQVCVLAVSRGVAASSGGRNWLFSSGPYGLVFGLLAMFAFDIPQSAPFKLFGLPLSDKLFVYLLGLQLAMSNLPQTAYSAIIPLVLGLLYRVECLPFHRLRIPATVASACSRVFEPLLSGSLFATLAGVQDRQGRRVGGSGRVGGPLRAPGMPAQQAPGGYVPVEAEGEVLAGEYPGYAPAAAAAYAPANVAADPAAIQQLVSMGFSEQRAIAALQATGNDVPAATNRLLGQ